MTKANFVFIQLCVQDLADILCWHPFSCLPYSCTWDTHYMGWHVHGRIPDMHGYSFQPLSTYILHLHVCMLKTYIAHLIMCCGG